MAAPSSVAIIDVVPEVRSVGRRVHWKSVRQPWVLTGCEPTYSAKKQQLDLSVDS